MRTLGCFALECCHAAIVSSRFSTLDSTWTCVSRVTITHTPVFLLIYHPWASVKIVHLFSTSAFISCNLHSMIEYHRGSMAVFVTRYRGRFYAQISFNHSSRYDYLLLLCNRKALRFGLSDSTVILRFCLPNLWAVLCDIGRLSSSLVARHVDRYWSVHQPL